MKKRKEIEEIEKRCDTLLDNITLYGINRGGGKTQTTLARTMQLSYLSCLCVIWRKEFDKHQASCFLIKWYYKIRIRGIEKQINKIPK